MKYTFPARQFTLTTSIGILVVASLIGLRHFNILGLFDDVTKQPCLQVKTKTKPFNKPLLDTVWTNNLRGENASTSLQERLPQKPKFISLCPVLRDKRNHRLGNQLFMFAAMLHVAVLTGRTIVMPDKGWTLDDTFDIAVKRTDNPSSLCPCMVLRTPHYNYDYRLDNTTFVRQLSESGRTIQLCGLSQTYLHAEKVNIKLRQLLVYKPTIASYVEEFKRTLIVQTRGRLGSKVAQVGVHVRRGDYISSQSSRFGLTVANPAYLKHALSNVMVGRHCAVRFIVATDDWKWVSQNYPNPDRSSDGNVETVFSTNPSVGFDFALLSSSDAVVMTTGSFGWWAAWMANTTTIYYDKFPRKDSNLYKQFKRANYFPPHWIPLS